MATISIDANVIASKPTVVFSDINFEMSALGESDLVYDANAIAKSLMANFSTYRGQRLFQPTLGGNLEPLLFEPCDESTASDIKRTLADAIAFDPDVVLINNGITVEAILDMESYFVTVNYAIPALEQEATLSFNLSRRK